MWKDFGRHRERSSEIAARAPSILSRGAALAGRGRGAAALACLRGFGT